MEVFDHLSDDEQEFVEILEYERRPYAVVPNRINHLDVWDDTDFKRRFRLEKNTVMDILTMIEHQLEYTTDRNHSIRPIDQLLLALRFYATGSFVEVVADFCQVSKSSASKIIKKVSNAIASLAGRFIKMPTTHEAVAATQLEFYRRARLPRVVGSIDCTHIKIQSPGGNNAELFRNRKGYFSINVQTISSASLEIMDIVARWPGSAHDQHIFDNSSVKRRLENNEFGHNSLLVADSGYANTMRVVTPLLHTRNAVEELYNESVIRTRNPVERQYGVWKRRFPVLALGLRLKLETTLAVIVATAVLHNIALRQNEQIPPMELEVDINENIFNEDIPVDLPENNNFRHARDILLADYFPTLLNAE